jgi:hypothetical protein
MHPIIISAFLTCVLILASLGYPETSYASEETVSGQSQSGGPLKRLVSRFSSTRESLMLSAICDPGTITLKKGQAGCARCPSFTGQSGDAGGFSIENIITGIFLKPNTSEALLNMTGCESRANASGGLVLLRQGKGGWNRIWYRPGDQLTDCLNFRTTRNVQSLLCNRSDVAQGIENGELVWVSLDENGVKVSPLMSWYDNIQRNPRELVVVYPSRMFRSDFNQDGRSDVRITFRLLEHRIPTKYSGALDAIEQGYQVPEAQKLGVIYLFDGLNLVVHPNSEKAVDTIRDLLDRHTEKH